MAYDEAGRKKAYRALFKYQIDGKLIEEIRQSVNKGMAVGSDTFKLQIEFLTGRLMGDPNYSKLILKDIT